MQWKTPYGFPMPIRLTYQVMTNHKTVNLTDMVGKVMELTENSAKALDEATNLTETECEVKEPAKPAKNESKGKFETALTEAYDGIKESHEALTDANANFRKLKNSIVQLTSQISTLNNKHLTPLVSNER